MIWMFGEFSVNSIIVGFGFSDGGGGWREGRLSYQSALFIGSELTISKEMVGTSGPYLGHEPTHWKEGG